MGKVMKTLVGGLMTINGTIVIATLVLFLGGMPAGAQEQEQQQEGGKQVQAQETGGQGDIAVGAGIAVGLAATGAGIGVGIAGSAAIGAITQKPEMFGRSLVFVGLAEGVAIYGLIIAFILLTGGL